MQIKLETVTPQMAREWLESTRINRPLRGDQVRAYARDMRNKQWRPVGDPIRISKLGELIDGQHRLSAIVESGVEIEMIVITGLEPEDQLVIDSGVKRRTSDHLLLAGSEYNGMTNRYAVRSAAVARAMYSIVVGRPFDTKLRVTNAEIFETLKKYPGILFSVTEVEGLQRLRGIRPVNAGIVHLLGYQRIPNTTYKFFADLRAGANLATTDPVLLLINRLSSSFDVGGGLQQLWLIMRALEMRKRDIFSNTKIQLPPGSSVTSEVLSERVNALLSFRDEREDSA